MKNKILSVLLSVTMLSSIAVASVNAGEAEVKDVYNITFNKGTLSSGTQSPSETVRLGWVSGEGYTPGDFKVTGNISGTSWKLVEDPEPAANESDDKALYVQSSSGQDKNDTYATITTTKFNPDYDAVNDFLCGENGYTEFSFDFYNDFTTNIRLTAGRFLDQNGAEVNKNTGLLYIYTDGRVLLQGTEITTIDKETYKNTWHNIKFVFKADNTYRAFLDDKPLIEWTTLTFDEGVSIRGVKDFRLYDISVKDRTSKKYYDNFRYSFSTSAYVEPTPEPTATPEPTTEPTATPEPTPEPAAEFTSNVGDAVVSGDEVTDGSIATGFVATVTNSGDAEGSFGKVDWAVTSGDATKGISVESVTTLEAGASVTYGLIVNGLWDADASASVTVE